MMITMRVEERSYSYLYLTKYVTKPFTFKKQYVQSFVRLFVVTKTSYIYFIQNSFVNVFHFDLDVDFYIFDALRRFIL